MFSTAIAICVATSRRKLTSVSPYWLGLLLATPSVPRLFPRATSGSITYERKPPANTRSSMGKRRPSARSWRTSGSPCWNTQPAWLSVADTSVPSGSSWPTAADDSRIEIRSTSLSGSWRKMAVRSNGTTGRNASAIAWNRASRSRFGMTALLISSSVRYRSAWSTSSPIIWCAAARRETGAGAPASPRASPRARPSCRARGSCGTWRDRRDTARSRRGAAPARRRRPAASCHRRSRRGRRSHRGRSRAGPEVPGELLAQGHPRTVQARLHRRDGVAHDLRDLLVGELLHVLQHEHRAVVLGQAVDRRLEDAPRLAGEQLALGRVRPVRHEEGTVPGAVAVRQVGGQQLVERGLQLAALTAPLVQAEIGRDPIDPAAQGGASFEAGALVDDLQKDVLGDLLGIGGAARDTVREPEDPRGVACHEDLERARVPGRRAREQAAIVGAQRAESTPWNLREPPRCPKAHEGGDACCSRTSCRRYARRPRRSVRPRSLPPCTARSTSSARPERRTGCSRPATRRRTGHCRTATDAASTARRCSPRARSSSGSEERRVGKECRSRWSPYHLKKNILFKVLMYNYGNYIINFCCYIFV